MAKLTIDELKKSVKDLLGDNTDDATLKFLEDFNDTISDVGSSTGDSEWKTKYDALVKDKEELDKAWRQRYRDRFFSTEDSHTDTKDENNNKDTNPANTAHQTTDEVDAELQAKSVRFDDLFTPKTE